ncbi:MAG: hypothetical protein WA125_05795 [Desulfosporosinus sp.]
MSRKRKFILGIMLVLAITILTAWPNITNNSRKMIVKRTLEIALVEKKLPDYELLNKEDSITLSLENIDPETIPKIPGVNFIVLSPELIQEKANNEGDVLYLRFSNLKVHFLQSSVSLDNSWATAVKSKKGYLSGGGFTIWFFNVLGNWINSPIISAWIL